MLFRAQRLRLVIGRTVELATKVSRSFWRCAVVNAGSRSSEGGLGAEHVCVGIHCERGTRDGRCRPPSSWEKLPRTSNGSEAWRSRLQSRAMTTPGLHAFSLLNLTPHASTSMHSALRRCGRGMQSDQRIHASFNEQTLPISLSMNT